MRIDEGDAGKMTRAMKKTWEKRLTVHLGLLLQLVGVFAGDCSPAGRPV